MVMSYLLKKWQVLPAFDGGKSVLNHIYFSVSEFQCFFDVIFLLFVFNENIAVFKESSEGYKDEKI